MGGSFFDVQKAIPKINIIFIKVVDGQHFFLYKNL